MNDARFARAAERSGDLPEDVEHDAGLDPPLALDQLAEVAASDVLLSDEVPAVGDADLVDLHDVAVHQSGGRSGFLLKPGDVGLVARQLGVEHLEGDLPLKRLLLGEIDLGHRPATEAAVDLVVAKRLAGQVVQVARRGEGRGGVTVAAGARRAG